MKSASTNSRRRVSADEALALWSAYKRTGDVQVRNRLVMTFAPLVKYIVFKKVRELPARWEVDIAKAREQFSAIHGRRPSREELADSLAISVEALRRREDDIAVSDVTSLNTLVIADDEATVERIDTLAGGEIDGDPEHSAMSTEAKSKFRRAFETLPKREREVAVLLYVKNLTLREIGEILGVSESRVCQIHSQLKRTLKAQLS